MRIRSGFVANSSSTSYVIIANGEFTRSDFFGLFGVTDESPLCPLFDALYQRVTDSMSPPARYLRERRREPSDLEQELSQEFSDEVARRIAKGIREGRSVYVGQLSSGEDPIQDFFCTDSFEVQNERLYFSALSCAW